MKEQNKIFFKIQNLQYFVMIAQLNKWQVAFTQTLNHYAIKISVIYSQKRYKILITIVLFIRVNKVNYFLRHNQHHIKILKNLQQKEVHIKKTKKLPSLNKRFKFIKIKKTNSWQN
ncbi:hypothetical protein TTHERM_000992891 (macronuclear) [Tetrahymena thermophila SB210]|uniref:Uncharacterized protein n=1 Tax=Tetrahymena thermophila (strain SB210) TaxID=312017 RepID=W7WXZ2_TETTS|nr:hypothetical protein TTHERM_000992891 [Tetrahymena thermophila SB210]EWS71730.1 hypothetical protein TTHERM_000992891 [Tetrahymena thermophila SB210]|eukprot:XP_012655738.1 hypothetical protein TTHERM_000992891 [Tetrahymena thermophila SB210]